MRRKLHATALFFALFFISLLLSSCANKLNENKPEASEKLAASAGISFPKKDSGGVTSSPTSIGNGGGTETKTYSDTKTGTLLYTDSYIIYRFYAYSYTAYTVSWTNESGALVSVSAGTSSSYITNIFSGTTVSSKTINRSVSGFVYIKVMPSGSSAGSFSLTVSNKLYSVSLSLDSYSTGTPPAQEKSVSVTGSLEYDSSMNIYRFYASAGTSYKLSWTNTTGAIALTAGKDSSFSSTSASSYYAYMKNSPTETDYFTPGSGYVYVRVKTKYGQSTYAGDYALTLTAKSSSVTVPSLSLYSSQLAAPITVGQSYSLGWEDLTEVNMTSTTWERSYSFSISDGYIMGIQFQNSENENYVSYKKEDSKSAGMAKLELHYADGTEFGETENYGYANSIGEAGGSYVLTLSPSKIGYVAFRVFAIPTPAKIADKDKMPVLSGKASSTAGFTSFYFSSSIIGVYKKFEVAGGKTYHIQYLDSENYSDSSVTKSSTYLLTDGLCIIYGEDGDIIGSADSLEEISFTPENDGTYILSVSKVASWADDGAVLLRLYADN